MNYFALAAILISLNASAAGAPSPIRAPVKKLQIQCQFTGDDNKTLEGYGYAESMAAEMTFAKVFVYQYDAAGNQKRKLGQYFLNYQPSPDLSLVFRFENKEKKTALEVFGDDGGGMSSFTVAGKTEDLTCSVEQ